MPRKPKQQPRSNRSSQPSPLRQHKPKEPLVRPSEVARLVQEKLQNGPAAVGRLDEKRIGLLLEFTKFLFRCPRAVIAIEMNSTSIHLAPILSADGQSDVFMTPEQWTAAQKTFDVARHESALPAFMSLQPYTVEFTREIREPTESESH